MTEATIKKAMLLAWTLFLAVALPLAACKELPKKTFGKKTSNEVFFKPAKGRPKVMTAPTPKATTELSTGEAALATEEWGAATVEEEVVTPERLYVPFNTPVYSSITPLRPKGVVPKDGELYIKPSDMTTEEYWMVSNSKISGYVNRNGVCLSETCIRIKRCGIVSVFVMSDTINAPQIQFQIINLNAAPLENLRMYAKFYYKDEPIGEDLAYVTSEAIGLQPLKRGQFKLVFMRANFNMPKGDVVSPQNRVKVELSCAIEGFAYAPCGVYYVDHMYY